MEGGQKGTGSNLLEDEARAATLDLQGSDLALHSINGGIG